MLLKAKLESKMVKMLTSSAPKVKTPTFQPKANLDLKMDLP